MNSASPEFPALVRLYFATGKVIRALAGACSGVWEEFLWAYTGSGQREEMNRAIREGRPGRLADGDAQDAGLFAWEALAVSEPPFPGRGRLLLACADGGGVLAAFCRLGYEVVAFEPSGTLFEGLQAVAGTLPGCSAARAAIRDLVDAAGKRGGTLDGLVGEPFDAVVFGGASFSQVFGRDDRLRLLKATRSLAPSGPLLLSFQTEWGAEPPGRLLLALRKALLALGAPSARERGDCITASGGFTHLYSAAEIEDLAAQAGYRVAYIRLNEYPHALYIPA